MSVQKTDILSFVNEKLLLSETIASIIIEINHVLKDLSKGKFPELYRDNVTEDQIELTSGTSSSNEPSGLRVLDYIIINDGDNDGRPLKLISFKKWLRRREDEASGNYEEPKCFARRGKKFYWDPIPDDSYTAKLWFWRWHPKTAGTTEDILFGDEYEDVICYGVCAEVAKTHERTKSIDLWEPRYEQEKARIWPQEDYKQMLVKYQD